MKLLMRAPDWNVVMAAIYAMTAPGPGALMALAPLLSLAGGMLVSLRRIFP
jgi:hypothetical protein